MQETGNAPKTFIVIPSQCTHTPLSFRASVHTPPCHSEPVITLAWESKGSSLLQKIATSLARLAMTTKYDNSQ